MRLLDIADDIIQKITNYLDFDEILILYKTNILLKNKAYLPYQNGLKNFASNYIKYYWFSNKLEKNKIICIPKKNTHYDSECKIKLSNIILTYSKNDPSNITHSKRCKQFLKKKFKINCLCRIKKHRM